MKRWMFLAGCAVLALVGAGCSQPESAAPPSNPAPPSVGPIGEPTASTSSKPIDTSKMTKTKTGLMYEDEVVGKGATAEAGKTVSVHYTGTLFSNGLKFDSSRDKGVPIDFVLGTKRVIAGWDEGLVGMKVGGKRRLVIPPELGYGEQGSPPDIPPNATLVFETELMDVQ